MTSPDLKSAQETARNVSDRLRPRLEYEALHLARRLADALGSSMTVFHKTFHTDPAQKILEAIAHASFSYADREFFVRVSLWCDDDLDPYVWVDANLGVGHSPSLFLVQPFGPQGSALRGKRLVEPDLSGWCEERLDLLHQDGSDAAASVALMLRHFDPNQDAGFSPLAIELSGEGKFVIRVY